MNTQPSPPASPDSFSHESYVLLTGATGLVGRYLIRDLLLKGVRLALLVRPSKRHSSHERIESVLQHWERELGQSLPRPIVLTGDVTEPQLGLSAKDVRWVSENCGHLIHNAAVLTFNGVDRTQEPWQTNFHGTKNVIEFAKQVGIENWHYVSTAYVCGRRTGLIPENDLTSEYGFRNEYEESKFEAEKMIREQAEGVAKLTVYRPAVIVGDSQTGFTSSYHGLFLYLRLLATLMPEQPRDENGVVQTPISLSISGNEPRNLVPVDWVSAAITRLFTCPEAHGQTFHLAPEKRVTSGEVVQFCYDYFNSDGVIYAAEDGTVDSSEDSQEPVSRFAEILLESSQMYEAYQKEDPKFATSNLKKYLSDLPCPEIDRQMIFNFIDFGSQDNWGKRREPDPEIPCWFGSRLMNISRFEALSPVKKATLGIDIHGPGGGQWQISIDGESRVAKRGLPPQQVPVITLDAAELYAKISESEESEANFWQFVFSGSGH